MKSLREYLQEAEIAYSRPVAGDNFAINIREEFLLETYVVDSKDDAIVIHADDRMMQVLEAFGFLGQELAEGHDYEADSDGEDVDVVDHGEYDYEGDQAKDQLQTIVRAARRLTGMLDDDENMPEWVQMKITKAADYVDTAADYIESNKEQGVAEAGVKQLPTQGADYSKYDTDHLKMMLRPGILHRNEARFKALIRKELQKREQQGQQGVAEGEMDEAKYQGREVKLGKPFLTPSGPKKRSVYVKNPKTGNIKKVNFGDPNMRIKKSSPDRRKSFRARHNCDNPGPKTSARYWSCRAW